MHWFFIQYSDKENPQPMHFLKSNKTITKPVLFLALLLSLSTIIGCNSKVATDAGSTEPDQSQETESGNEISSNEVSSDSITENSLSENAVSENTVSSNENETVENTNLESKEISPLVEPIEESRNYFKRLTEEEKIIYQLGYSGFLDSEKPENGIYETNFDISIYGEEYSKYKDYKNGDKDFILLYNFGYASAIENTMFKDGEIYISITMDGDYEHPLKIANMDTLSIIKPNNGIMNRFYIIKDYQGEEVIEANTYENFANGNLIDVQISNFTVTPVRRYLERLDARVDIPYDKYIMDISPSYFLDSQYLNK